MTKNEKQDFDILNAAISLGLKGLKSRAGKTIKIPQDKKFKWVPENYKIIRRKK